MVAIRGRQRTAWQDRYSIQTVGNIDYVPRFDPATDIGLFGIGSGTTGAYLLDLINHPHLQPPNSTEFTRLATGKAQMSSREYQQLAAEVPTISLEMQLNAYVLAMFITAFYQDGARDAGSTVLSIRGYPYTISDVSKYLCMARQLDTPDSSGYFTDPSGLIANATYDMSSHFMTGMVPTSLGFNFEEGASAKLNVECNGSEFGIMGVCGRMNRYTHSTRRLYVRPSPAQVGHSAVAPDTTFDIFAAGTAITTLNTVATEANFTAPSSLSAGTVEVAVDTGAINFSDADAATMHGQLITHDAYKASSMGETWAYTHPNVHLPIMVAPLLWQNATNYMKAGYYTDGSSARESPSNWVQVKLPGLSLTLNNNLVARFYDEPRVDSFVLGDFTAEGNLVIPWGTDKATPAAALLTLGGNTPLVDYIQGHPMRLRTIFGGSNHVSSGTDPDATGHHVAYANAEHAVVIDAAIRYTENSLEGENELGQSMGFSVVELEGPLASAWTGNDTDRTSPIIVSAGVLAAKTDHGLAAAPTYPVAAFP